MLGLSFEKLLVVALIAVFVIGPDRLPLYAGRLAEFVRSLRGRSEVAKARVKQELGDDFDIDEWKRLDPRQYDPRRIVREALADTVDPAPSAPPAPQQATPAPAQPETSIARLMRTSRNRSVLAGAGPAAMDPAVAGPEATTAATPLVTEGAA
ncbi:Sec-independent protein translocase TatB [Cryobacterium sp. SO2]|uniref:Sec-independent protein translocase TatB n=1 Tax=Cryobacterium sp. SO2 TaxID=1897060 RepID=UPI00223D0971|nr:Sec-independent protein translocase TatB [Cryobacterium sp. SO2]WEO77206.1 Sec-independent protein translocase TatB [Cryobacterium sp. SO2]